MSIDPRAELVRSEERLVLLGTEWRPHQRFRVRKQVVTEEVTRTVTIRREELVVEPIAIGDDQDLEGSADPTSMTDLRAEVGSELEVILHRDEVVIETRPVAYQRVLLTRGLLEEQREVSATVRVERVEVERRPAS